MTIVDRTFWLALAFGAVSATGAAGKAGRTWYTPERIAAARANIAEHAWAQARWQQILTQPPATAGYPMDGYVGADRQTLLSDEQLLALMPPVTIPRKWQTNPTSTCPVHGTAIKQRNAYYPWRLDFANQPYKVICPVGGEVYPSNDFAAGDLTSGPYPDDGSGCLIDGQRYQFISYWTHAAYLAWVRPTISALAEAYLVTAEPRYGRQAAIALAGLARQFPGPSHHREHCYGGAYGRRSGGVTDYIWECIAVPKLALAYDAIWPIYDQDPSLLAFLAGAGLPAESPAAAREFIEERLLRQAAQGLLDGALSGNPGHHQEAAAVLALVLDDHSDRRPNSLDLMRFAYHAGYAPTAWVMSNFLTRDGGGYEGPGYDRIKFNYVRVADLTEELRRRRPELYPESEFPRIMAEPKARAMYDFFSRVVSLDYYVPEIGDAGGSWLNGQITAPQYRSTVPAWCVDGFRRYGDPTLARAALGVKGEMPAGLDLFSASPEAALREAAARPEAASPLGTRLLDGYGLAYLHSGDGPRRREAVVNYSALMGHAQDDYLALNLYANAIAYLPDLGYPFTWEYRQQWDSNLYTHNTVVVDGAKPLSPHQVAPGWVRLIGDAGWLQATAVAHQPYQPHPTAAPDQPPVSRYERICVLVAESDADAYLLDLFLVQGGSRHDQSWHSVTRQPDLPDLAWVDQPDGTAAGPDVPFNGSYLNRRGQETRDGLCFVTDVKRATVTAPVTFAWDFQLREPAGLRLHVVPVDGPQELITGGGRSPARPADWRLPFVFVRHESDDEGLASRFLTILEPHRGDPAARITAVEASGQWPLLVRVHRGDTVDEISIDAPAGPEGIERGEPTRLAVSARTRRGGQVVRSARLGAVDDAVAGVRRGVITDLDRAAQTITVDAALPAGVRWIRLHSPGRSSLYEVVAAAAASGGQTVLTLRETSLLARGLPVGYQDQAIQNDAPIPFATFPVKADQEPPVHTDRFRGARVETADGRHSYRLRGIDGRNWITGTADYDLFLEGPAPATELERAFGTPGQASLFEVHDYGRGDHWEVMLTRAEGGD